MFRHKFLARAGMLALMLAFGIGVYAGIGLLKAGASRAAGTPTETKSLIDLPGTMYLAQQGALFRLQGKSFTQMSPSPGGWTQPTVSPDGNHLIAVSRQSAFSDLYLLGSDGNVITQLTHNAAGKHQDISANHWAFYPQFTPDGNSVVYSYDSPKNQYLVDFAIWSQPIASASAPTRQWSTSNNYTGGDVRPIALASGGLIYSKFSSDNQGNINSQIWLQGGAGRTGAALTTAADNCGEPALSPDGSTLAMVCTQGQQHADLVTAPFDGSTLGVHHTIVSGTLCAVPAWAPDGSGMAYLAPADSSGHFQLWWLAGAASSTPKSPQQATANLDFDATSAPAWH